MKRVGSAVAIAAGVLAIVLVGAVGGMIFLGDTQQTQSQGSSGNNIGGMLSNGFSMVKNGLSFAAGGGLAEVQTATIGLIADTFTGSAPVEPTCSATPKNSYIQLVNTGSTNGTATSVTITYGGANNRFLIAGQCTIGPSGSSTATMYVLFKGPSQLPNSSVPEAGEPFVGGVALASGAHLPFTGKFYSGYPSISTTGVALLASDFAKGQPTNSTCASAPRGHSYIMLNNTGTIGANATDVTIYSKNSTSTIPVVGSCNIGPDGTPSAVTYILFGTNSKLNFVAVAAQSFNGTVSLSNRSDVPFKGTFQ